MKFLKKIVKIVFFCQIENNLKLNPFPRSPLEQRIIQMETNLQFFFVFFMETKFLINAYGGSMIMGILFRGKKRDSLTLIGAPALTQPQTRKTKLT